MYVFFRTSKRKLYAENCPPVARCNASSITSCEVAANNFEANSRFSTWDVKPGNYPFRSAVISRFETGFPSIICFYTKEKSVIGFTLKNNPAIDVRNLSRDWEKIDDPDGRWYCDHSPETCYFKRLKY